MCRRIAGLPPPSCLQSTPMAAVSAWALGSEHIFSSAPVTCTGVVFLAGYSALGVSPFCNLWVYVMFYSVSPEQSIISDLFPGVVLPTPDYELFVEAVTANIRKMDLQPVPWFIGKIIQVPLTLLGGRTVRANDWEIFFIPSLTASWMNQ